MQLFKATNHFHLLFRNEIAVLHLLFDILILQYLIVILILNID